MIKAILRYIDYMQDGKSVFSVLAKNNVEILKTKHGLMWNMHPEITIKVTDLSVLNKIVYEINSISTYEVSIKKTKKVKA